MDWNRLKWPLILFEGRRKGVSCSSLHSRKGIDTLVGTQLTTWLVICGWIWLQSNVNWKSMPKKSKQNMICLSLRQRTFKFLHPDIQVFIVNIVYYSLLLELMYALIVKSVYHLFDFRNDEQEIYHFTLLFINLHFF